MAFRHIFDDKAQLGKQIFRCMHYLLSVLQRTSGVIGDRQARRRGAGLHGKRGEIFGHVPGQRGYARRLDGIGRIVAEHEAIVLHRRAAAGNGDENRVEGAAFGFRCPGIDQTARLRQRLLLAAHVMHQRAAAGVAFGDRHLDAVPVEQANRRLVGRGTQHRPDAAGQKRHPAAPLARRRKYLAGEIAH